MSDTSKFLADIQRIKKHVRADNGGKYDGRKVCEQISSLFASSNRNAGDLARSIADYWLNSYIFASARKISTESRFFRTFSTEILTKIIRF